MNILQAKTEIGNTLRAYLRKDEAGRYLFPSVRQRPLLLMGPPGIGKTAIMEQLARELELGLVSYTMTHHTRQSAIGLPQIVERTYGEETLSVTRYTMSEIIASVYDAMESTGRREGILFLDEINCVSDTLAPTMLQFLQCKTFGTHRLPDGWVIVAAGNPAEYNKSVREFDVVTLDRLRTIEVEPDTEVFLRYGREQGLHGAVLSYLRLHPEKFYHVSREENRLFYVTARGWEDLSTLLTSYEELGLPLSEEVFSQYLRLPETCRQFYGYYSLFRKYGDDYCLSDILAGTAAPELLTALGERLKGADLMERFAVAEMLLQGIRTGCIRSCRAETELADLHAALKDCLERESSPVPYTAARREAFETKKKYALLGEEELRREETVLTSLERLSLELQGERITEKEAVRERCQAFLDTRHARCDALSACAGAAVENGIAWLRDTLGPGAELTALLSGMTGSKAVMSFIARCGSRAYLSECGCLQVREEEEKLRSLCLDAAKHREVKA